MNYKELKYYASNCEMIADEMAFKFVKLESISIVQSICDFNLSWLYQLSPEVILHTETIEFLEQNIKKFKRKLKLKEIILFDTVIYWKKPEDFNQFKKLIK